jgi:hypothetical protein
MTRPLRSIGFFAALAVAMAVLAAAGNARAQELRYQFEKGKRLLYSLAQNVDVLIKAEGVPEQQMKIDQTTEMSWTVEDVQEDGTARIVQSIDRIKMDLTAPPNVDFQYDSASEEEPTGALANMIKPTLEAIVGAKFTVTMNSRGQIKEIQVPQEVVEAAQKAPNAAQMGEMFTKEGFEKMVRQSLLTFPEGELKPGREWTETMEVPVPGMGGQQTVKTTYQYVGQEDVDGQTLDAFSVSQSMEFGDGAGPAGGKISVKDQESTGKLFFDRAAGHVSSSNMSSNMTMEITVFGTTMTQQLKQNVQVDVKQAE